jgi:hypothetical protein
MDASGTRVGSVGGDIIGIDVKGSGNIIGKNISIETEQLKKIPNEYANSLKTFVDIINQQFRANNVSQDKVAEVQKNVDEFSKELEGLTLGQDPGIVKRSNLKSKLINIAKAALVILPKTVPAVLSAFTPLQPFNQLIGEDIEILVKAIQKEI